MTSLAAAYCWVFINWLSKKKKKKEGVGSKSIFSAAKSGKLEWIPVIHALVIPLIQVFKSLVSLRLDPLSWIKPRISSHNLHWVNCRQQDREGKSEMPAQPYHVVYPPVSSRLQSLMIHSHTNIMLPNNFYWDMHTCVTYFLAGSSLVTIKFRYSKVYLGVEGRAPWDQRQNFCVCASRQVVSWEKCWKLSSDSQHFNGLSVPAPAHTPPSPKKTKQKKKKKKKNPAKYLIISRATVNPTTTN